MRNPRCLDCRNRPSRPSSNAARRPGGPTRSSSALNAQTTHSTIPAAAGNTAVVRRRTTGKRDAAAGGAGAAGSRGVRTRSEGLEAGNGAVIDDRTAVVVGLLRQSFPRWTDLPGERAPTGARLTKLTRIRRALARRAVRGPVANGSAGGIHWATRVRGRRLPARCPPSSGGARLGVGRVRPFAERYRSGRNGGASKASCRVTGTWVRIPPSPPLCPCGSLRRRRV